MLSASQQEIDHVTNYMRSQAPDLTVTFLQKVHSESLSNHRHDVWDVHTNVDRWWVITNPTNLYSQSDFPNIDFVVTFHMGLCVRIPRSEKQKLSDLPVEPFLQCYRLLSEASDGLAQAEEVADFQTIGVRCREALLAFVGVAQDVMPWPSDVAAPKRGDLKAWADHICNISMSGATNEYRRHLFKSQIEAAWRFANWLTHAKGSNWYDAEAACTATETAITLCTSAAIRFIRGVPDACPNCGSHRLDPERGVNSAYPGIEWERPVCAKCGWKGDPVPIGETDHLMEESDGPLPDGEPKAPEGDCTIPEVPLTKLRRPDPR